MSKKYMLEVSEKELAILEASFVVTASELLDQKDNPFLSIIKVFLMMESKSTLKLQDKIKKLFEEADAERENKKKDREERENDYEGILKVLLDALK